MPRFGYLVVEFIRWSIIRRRTCPPTHRSLHFAPLPFWLEDGFDDLAGVHFLECFVPLAQRPDAADDFLHVKSASREQADHASPTPANCDCNCPAM